MKIIALFNNKGGVGKTTLAHHLAHMFPRLGYPTVAVDLDPQANLTAAFFDDEYLEAVWDRNLFGETVLTCVQPILDGTGDIAPPAPLPVEVAAPLSVLVGDLGLARFEDKLSEAWPKGYMNDQSALRTTSAFYRIIRQAGESEGASLALVDVGPNLGAINRAALLAADHIVIPLAADLYSLRGLSNLGPTLREWRHQWGQVRALAKTQFELPEGALTPAGYVVMQHAVRLDRPAAWYRKWMDRIPTVYAGRVLDTDPSLAGNHCLATLRNYRSLMPMAQEARKPMFDLKPADGAIGSHVALVRDCERDFRTLCEAIARACSVVPAGAAA